MTRTNDAAEWLRQASKRFAGRLVYVKTPSGMGCCLEEALQLYAGHVLPPRTKTFENELDTVLKAPLKRGGWGVFFRVWAA